MKHNDPGCSILDTGCWILDPGFWMLDDANQQVQILLFFIEYQVSSIEYREDQDPESRIQYQGINRIALARIDQSCGTSIVTVAV